MSQHFLTCRSSAHYVSERIGRRVTLGAMHRHASDGTGPRYRMILGRASYTVEDLDAWIEQLVQPPLARLSATKSASAAPLEENQPLAAKPEPGRWV